ncbi:MAG: hypothetical protein M3P18_11050 [Actinomycetota bacterium]|nr:hypothetical protein [Actinomycetota bacterium]
MRPEACHLFSMYGRVYAALLDGDQVVAAQEVERPELDLLDAQTQAALDEPDPVLCDWLTDQLACGACSIIGAYFSVDV